MVKFQTIQRNKKLPLFFKKQGPIKKKPTCTGVEVALAEVLTVCVCASMCVCMCWDGGPQWHRNPPEGLLKVCALRPSLSLTDADLRGCDGRSGGLTQECFSKASLRTLPSPLPPFPGTTLPSLYVIHYSKVCNHYHIWINSRGVDKTAMVHLHHGILLGHNKEENFTICKSVDRPGEHYTKWNKPIRERQMPYDFTHMWNVRNKLN